MNNYYRSLHRGLELIHKGYFNGLIVCSGSGLGKTFQIDKTLNELKADYKIFSGTMSELKFFEFLSKNSNKILVFREAGKLLRNVGMIDVLKNLVENKPTRHLERLVKGNEIKIDFRGSIIIELNEVSKRYKKDINALLERGLFIELNFSFDDIKNIMLEICNKDKEKIEVTNYLFKNANLLNSNFNLRTQDRCLTIYEASKRDKLEWKSQIDLYLKNKLSEPRKLLYKLAGNKKVKRINFVRFLMRELDVSYPTAQRRVSDWLITKDIYSDGLLRQANLSIKEFGGRR